MSDLIVTYGEHLGASRASSTVTMRLRILRRANAALEVGLDQALPEELEAWLARGRDRRGRPWSRQTKASYHDTITGYLRWASRRGHLSYDASAGLLRPRPPRGLPRPATEHQLRHALVTLAEPWRTYVVLSAFAGMRGGEISALDREHVTDYVLIHGKGGKTRLVKTRPEVRAAIQHFPPGPIARLAKSGRRASPDHVTSRTALKLDQVGLPELTLHSFRHRFGTLALARTGNIRVVQELLGHESPASTAIYTLVTDPERDAAVDALPGLD